MNKLTEAEIKEFNDFLGENKVRNQFLPVMHHICKMTKDLDIKEYADKDENTTCIRFQVRTGWGFIDGRVGWDAFDKNKISFELWWSEEDYCLLPTVVRMQNWLTLLIKRGDLPMYGFKTYEELKAYRKCDTIQTLL
jgi:hypothetical protein